MNGQDVMFKRCLIISEIVNDTNMRNVSKKWQNFINDRYTVNVNIIAPTRLSRVSNANEKKIEL